MEYLLTGAEMSSCDRRTSEEIGIPSLVLMERAALSVADGIDRRCRKEGARQAKGLWEEAGRPVILAVAGRGNNGADALAAGRILLERGYDVRFCRLSGDISPGSSFAVQEKILRQLGKSVEPFSSCAMLSDVRQERPADIIIDGLFGTGLSRDLAGEAADCVRAINRSRDLHGSYVVAVDIPSGISSDDGRVMGCAVRCDETRTFAFYKRGHFLYPGASYAGVCHLAQIGITDRAFAAEPGMFTFLEERAADLLPDRTPGGNKGTFGKVLIVAGRRNMCGAAYLAARACLSSGAGMVRVFTHEANRLIIQQMVPEALLDTYTDDSVRAVDEAARNLRRSLDWADLAAAGPAMGTDAAADRLLRTLLEYAGDPAEQGADHDRGRHFRGLVLDADALRLIAGSDDLRRLLARRRRDLPCILTPHMGEFAALAGKSVEACVRDRSALVQDQADLLRCVIACKDARTLVAAPSGRRAYLNCSGNSGMASAGSGDVLTGLTAGLLAQFTGGGHRQDRRSFFSAEEAASGFETACCAVYLHGRAGDAARSKKDEYRMTARDLIENLFS